MQFSEYRVAAAKTAIYPERKKIVYPGLGLAGEAGEVSNQVKKIFRDDNGIPGPARIANIIAEVGGVYWYCAALANDLEIEQLPPSTAQIEEQVELEALLLAGDAGDIAAVVYQFAIRHSTAEDLLHVYRIDEDIAWVLKRLEHILTFVGSTPAECMQANLDKLADRSVRGTLKGDGDHR